jgi:uncharacterized protein
MHAHEINARQSMSGQTVVIFFGMTASGKSTLGKAWAAQCRVPYYNTDRIRKELAGLRVSDKRPDNVGQGIYTPAYTEQTYEAMLDHAKRDFARGAQMVVLDGSYSRHADRDRVRLVAAEMGVRCLFILCACSEDEVRRRLELRTRDPEAVSDGRWEIYLHQKRTFDLPDTNLENDCIRLNTEQPVEVMLTWLAAQPCLQG